MSLEAPARAQGRLQRLRGVAQSPRGLRVTAELGLAMAGVIWGVNFVLVKFAMDYMQPLYYVGLRFLVAAVILAPFSVKRLRRLDRRGWLMGCGVGVILFGGFACQTIGLLTISPGLSGFLTGLYVIFVPLILLVFTGKWPSPLLAVGVVVVVGGLALLSIYGELGFGWGEVITVFGAVLWATHILAVAHGTPRISAVAFVELQMIVCAVLSLLTAFVFERPQLFPGWQGMSVVLWTGLMGGVVAYLLMVLGQRHAPPTLAGVLMSLEAVFALIVSIIWGYDSITPRILLGFMLVFAGTTLARFGSEREPALAVEPAPPAP